MMFQLQRCQHCGDLATQKIDDVHLCDKLECEAAQLISGPTRRMVG